MEIITKLLLVTYIWLIEINIIMIPKRMIFNKKLYISVNINYENIFLQK